METGRYFFLDMIGAEPAFDHCLAFFGRLGTGHLFQTGTLGQNLTMLALAFFFNFLDFLGYRLGFLFASYYRFVGLLRQVEQYQKTPPKAFFRLRWVCE